jgi:membrane fusion protein (multidrug efflux system)
MDTQQQSTAGCAEGTSAGKWKKRVIVSLAIIATGCLGGFFWVHGKTHITTDNAFIQSPIHTIAPRVSGAVVNILVKDNQLVHKGDLLLVLDDRDAQAEVDKAVAEFALAHNETDSDRAQVESARAELAKNRAQVAQAGLDLKRAEILFRQKVIPKEQLDRLLTNQAVVAAQAQESEQRLHKAIATLGEPVGNAPGALVAKRQAELATARLKLSYTRIHSPVDGYVTHKSVERGNWVQPGQALMAVVALHDSWIIANYKESQLTDVRPGMQVEFTVDTYPGTRFTGRVDSIMAGTGAAFSLLPPENATGNYVKVTQRIPVKIAMNQKENARHPLRVGMSVVPVILVPKTLGDLVGISPGPLKLLAQVMRGDDVTATR